MADSLEQAAMKALEALTELRESALHTIATASGWEASLDSCADAAGTAIAALRSALHQEAGEADIYIQRDHLQKAMQAPFLCRVTTEPRSDRVPLYTSPPIEDGKCQPLGACHACGEGLIYPFATTVLHDGKPMPLLMHRCDHCKAEMAGELESAANLAIVRAAAIATRQGTK